MPKNHWNLPDWRTRCRASAERCSTLGMTPVHQLMILGQAIDDALKQLHPAQHPQAIAVAREFGYETPEERVAMQSWLAARRAISAG